MDSKLYELMWVGLPRTCCQMDERYVTEEGIDMTEESIVHCCNMCESPSDVGQMSR